MVMTRSARKPSREVSPIKRYEDMMTSPAFQDFLLVGGEDEPSRKLPELVETARQEKLYSSLRIVSVIVR